MAEVLAAPATQQHPSATAAPSALPPFATHYESSTAGIPRTATRERLLREEKEVRCQRVSYALDSMSHYSTSAQPSRPHSITAPVFHSSLPYAFVRDFAYPSYHPMHFGGPPDGQSGASTPSELNGGRRLSESAESSASGGKWPSAGPWGGDGILYRDPDHAVEPLPSTSFGNVSDDCNWADGETSFSSKHNKHRKSRSFNDMPNYERGRRRGSARLSREVEGETLFQQPQNQQAQNLSPAGQYDPAGRQALRQSRGFTMGSACENGQSYGDSRSATTLPNRSFHTSQPVDPDSDLPLDAEPSDHHSPQRESMGPEDEELFAGPSLALYSFEPENENELRVTEGEVIMVSYRHGQGWLVAENQRTGEQGLVPEAYVRLLRDIEGWDEETGQFIDDDPFAGGEDEQKEEEEAGGHTTPIAEHAASSSPVVASA